MNKIVKAINKGLLVGCGGSDTTAPTMTISAAKSSSPDTDFASGGTHDGTLSMTFTSSDPTTDFVVGDITVENGALSAFAAVTGSTSVYTATFTAAAAGACRIRVLSGKFTDAAERVNVTEAVFSWTKI